MHKLETKNSAPAALAKIEFCSLTAMASIVLASDEVRKEINGQWQVDPVYRKQILSCIGADGMPLTIEGKVPDSEVVEIAAAYKVVVLINVANELKGAFAAGRVSKAYTSLELVRVVEVWDTPKNCLWRAKELPQPTTAAIDESGKIVRAA